MGIPEEEKKYTVTRVYDAVTLPIVEKMTPKQLQKAIEKTKKEMLACAKDLRFIEAAQLRDEMLRMQDLLDKQTQTANKK